MLHQGVREPDDWDLHEAGLEPPGERALMSGWARGKTRPEYRFEGDHVVAEWRFAGNI
jgi:hypothetical protein